ncbi:MAG: hypothetical protein ACRDWS_14980 [Acidimicrobiia bacterium]
MSNTSSRRQQALMSVVAVCAVGSGLSAILFGGPIWVVSLIALVVGWRYVPGFWRIVGLGALGGAVAGTLILGPGFRVAMRVVAILDPVRNSEFTLEGTFFIVLTVGSMLGGLIAIGGGLIRSGFRLSGSVTAIIMTLVIMGLLLSGSDLRSEFVDLGAGPWLNIPMFGSVVFLYALAANKLIDRIAARRAKQTTREPVEVQA